MAEKHRYRMERFGIRLFDEEKKILEMKAAEQGMSRTEYIRDLILFGEVKTTKKKILTDEKFKKLLYEINRIGNNINQIAYNSNLKKSTGREEIKELSEKYDSLLQLYSDTFLYPDNENDEVDEV